LTFADMTQNRAFAKMYKEEQDYFRWVGNRKICLIFGQHIVDGISYNVTSRYHGFHMSGLLQREGFAFCHYWRNTRDR